jgi:lysophospholipase L1-like esterase
VRPRLGRAALAALLVATGVACAGSGSDQTQRVEVDPGGSRPVVVPHSIVQLGDSIASGEGTLYGYTYDASTKEWTGGDVNTQWPLPHPDCHVSADAYGFHVASAFGAQLHQFACTGATFDVGIAGPMTVAGVTRRPAEFGNWDTKQNLNADYDSAQPDLVLITLGADDVDFSDIVEDCVKSAYKYYWFPKTYPLECVDGNPGPSVQQHFFNDIDTLKKNYVTLVKWIEERADANNVAVPKVLFTNYANPLPDAKVECNDTSYLYDQQVQYLAKLLAQMNGIIESTIAGIGKKNVAVVDISRAYQPAGVDHRWCSADPWAYGLSIYHFTDPSSFSSNAPFHPTPAGQEAIAEGVVAGVSKLFQTEIPVDTTTSTAAPSTTSTTSAPSTSTTTAPSTTTSTTASTSTTTSTTAP